MKEEYFTPQVDMLAFNYASVVSASLDSPTIPTSPSGKTFAHDECDTGFPGQGGGNGHGGGNGNGGGNGHGGGNNKTLKKKDGCT